MRRKTTTAERLALAASRGFHNSEVEKKREFVPLAPPSQEKYHNIGILWTDFCTEVLDSQDLLLRPHLGQPSAEIFKRFVKFYASSTKGILHDKPTLYTTLHFWRTFSGLYKRETNVELEPDLINNVSSYIQGTLKDELSLSTVQRVKPLTTVVDLGILMNQLWAMDCHDYLHERYRIQIAFALTLFCASSARAGAIVESNGYRNSNHGLTYQDVELFVGRRQDSSPEFQLKITQRLMKGMRQRESENLTILLYEPQSLQYSGVMYFLALALADRAIKGISTVEELLCLRPPEGRQLFRLHWNKNVLSLPVLRMVKPTGAENRALTYASLAAQVLGLANRAGYRDRLTIHCIRRGVANSIDKIASTSEKAQLLGHVDGSMYQTHYISSISGVDAQAGFLRETLRSDHIESQRSMSARREAMLPQKLPAEQELAFNNRSDVQTLDKDVSMLTVKIGGDVKKNPELFKQRQRLYTQKRKLRREAIERYQKEWIEGNYEHELQQQLDKPEEQTESTFQAPSQETFSSIRRFMPERDRLASNIFSEESLRSKCGQAVLCDLVQICTHNESVAYAEQEKPLNGHCPVASCNVPIERQGY